MRLSTVSKSSNISKLATQAASPSSNSVEKKFCSKLSNRERKPCSKFSRKLQLKIDRYATSFHFLKFPKNSESMLLASEVTTPALVRFSRPHTILGTIVWFVDKNKYDFFNWHECKISVCSVSLMASSSLLYVMFGKVRSNRAWINLWD